MFFPLSVDRIAAPALRLLGVRPDRDGVLLHRDRVIATFGFFNMSVPMSNVAEARVTGPYRLYKAVGPRLSLADHGITFGATATAGACLRFIEPVPPVLGPWRHPGLTITVSDPAALVDAVTAQLPDRS